MSFYSFKDAGGVTRNTAASSLLSGLGPQVNIVDSTGNNTAFVGADGALKIGGSVLTIAEASSSSTIVVLQAASIVGTYAEDAASATNDKGVFVLGVRNDTMSSVTSADGDYSAYSTGPIGEVIVAPAPITKWLSAQTSVMYGVSVQGIAPQGSSIFTYVTGMQILNDSPTYSRVKITGGLGSVLAWTAAPAQGGSNVVFNPPLRAGANSGISASISGVSSVYVSLQGFISKI